MEEGGRGDGETDASGAADYQDVGAVELGGWGRKGGYIGHIGYKDDIWDVSLVRLIGVSFNREVV